MVEVGKLNTLPVSRECDFGLLLDGDELGEILMPKRYVTEAMKTGGPIEVFIMLDSEDRLTATLEKPKVMVGEYAYLRVVSVTNIGAFLDWGLGKDLFLPFREQKMKVRQGDSVIVHVYYDRASGRIAASSKTDKFLIASTAVFKEGEQVDLLITAKTDLGFKAIINNEREGIIFHNEVFGNLHRGKRVEGFIKQVRSDDKIDLCLQKPGYEKVSGLTNTILDYLKEQPGGYMPITDKNPPQQIYSLFGMSKKTYKKAIGALYKQRLIEFVENGTRLVKK